MKEKNLKVYESGKRPSARLASFRLFGLGVLTLSLSSCVMGPTAPSSPEPSEAPQESEAFSSSGDGAKRLVSSLTNSLASGFSLQLDEATLRVDDNNVFDFRGGSLSFSLEALSLHGLSIALNAPVDYNGSGERRIDASLVNDELYFDLSCPQEKDDPYEVRYKVSTASYVYEENGSSHESVTGGIYQYEFGRLDWILDDVLQILSGYGVNISPKTDKETATIDWDRISASLNGIEETSGGSRYFVWELPLGENVYPVGLSADSSYALSGIDFPAKGSPEGANSLGNGMSLNLSATFLQEGVSILPPEDASSYLSLDNSIDLWERLATYGGKQAFSLSSHHEENGVQKEGLILTHKEDEVPDTDEAIGHPAIDESAVFSLEAKADLKGGKINDLSAVAKFQGEKQTKILEAHFLEGNPDQQICLNVNNIIKAKTSKTTADALFSAFGNILGDEAFSNEYLSALLNAANSISKAIDSIKESEIGKDFSEGHYEHLIGTISKLEAKDNQILATLDMAKAGSKGALEILLSGTALSLAEIRFDGFELGYFGIEGALTIGDYVQSEGFDASEYEEMDHLPGLTDQLQTLFQTHSATANFQGYILDKGTTAISQDTRFAELGGKQAIVEEGFTFEGSLSFNLLEKAGSGKAVFLDRKKDYLNEHAISVQVDGDEKSNGNMVFGYSSKNDNHNGGIGAYKDMDYGNITEPKSEKMYGRFSVASLNDLLSCVSALLDSDDPRFTKFTAAGDALATTLVAKIAQGQLAPLFTDKILISAERSGDTLSAVISKSVLGSVEDVALKIVFGDSGISLLQINLPLEEQEIFLSIGLSVPSDSLSKEDLLLDDLESHKESATDFSSLPILVDYLLGSATLGEDNSKQSTYYLSGTIKMKALKIIDLDISFSLVISLMGAEVKMIGSFAFPIVVAVNTTLNGGTRYVEFYYHTSGNDQDGMIYMHRLHDYTLGSDSEDYAKVKSSDFASNLINWLCGYALGLNDNLMKQIQNSSSSDETGSSIHGEDLIKKYVYTQKEGGAAWDMKLDLSSLTSVLSKEISLTFEGKEVNTDNGKEKTIASLSGSAGLLKIIDIDLNVSLANVSTGTYVPVWTQNSSSKDDQITFHKTKKNLLITSTESYQVHARDTYEANFYGKDGYVTTGQFAKTTLYTDKYTG